MKNTFKKFLPVVLGLAMTSSMAFAADPISASSTYEIELKDYLKITANNPNKPEVDYTDGLAGAELHEAIVGGFSVVSNKPSRTLYLQGTCVGASTVNALRQGADNGSFRLVLANTASGQKPADQAIAKITKTAAPADTTTANCVALDFTVAMTNSDGETPSSAFDTSTNDSLDFTIPHGNTEITFTTTDKTLKAFSTADTVGTYQATLTLTDTKAGA